MPSSWTVANLRAEILELLDETGSGNITTARINQLIVRKLDQVYNLLVGLYEDYFATSVALTISANAAYVDLDSAITSTSSVLKIDKLLYLDSQVAYELPPMLSADYAYEKYPNTTADPRSFKWLLRGNKVLFNASSGSSWTLYLWYVPAFNESITSTASITWRVPVNWSDAVIYGVCADMREKWEEDPGYFDKKFQEAKQEIFNQAMNRNLQSDSRVYDAWHRWF